MEPDPSARLRATRAALQRRFEAREHDLGEHARYQHGEYEHGIARWLVSQLPGSDPRQLGWGILAVAAMLLGVGLFRMVRYFYKRGAHGDPGSAE